MAFKRSDDSLPKVHALHGPHAATPTPGLLRYEQPGSVGGRGNRRGAGRRPRAGAAAQAASGSRSWCRRRGCTARLWRPARTRWRGRRRAAPRTAPAAPRSAGPRPGRARSPPNQTIEHKFESESGTLPSPPGPPTGLGGPRWGRNPAEPEGQQRTAEDKEPRGQRLYGAIDLGCETAGVSFHTAVATALSAAFILQRPVSVKGSATGAWLPRRL